MSASIIDDYNISNHPTNYLEYIDGDKQFGKLKSGDIIYYYSFDTASIFRAVVKSDKILHRNGMSYISINPIKIDKNHILTKLIFGPISGSAIFGEINGIQRSYRYWIIDDSSLCVNINGNFIFGTNRNSVLKAAKENLKSRLNYVNEKIEELKTVYDFVIDKLINLK
jgi:hypothetical protein